MINAAFSHIRTWIFDLDNTLYHPSARLFDQIEVRMTDWVMRCLDVDRKTADRMRTQYWADHGTTLTGLMREHDVDPYDYLHDVHQINLDHLIHDTALARQIEALPGRRIVFTNGSRPYANAVLNARGLGGTFDAVYGVEHSNFISKPARAAFEHILAHEDADPTRAAMFEDVPRNLEAPHAMGMRTVLVAADPDPAAHIHHCTDDLTVFLSQVRPLEMEPVAAK